MKRFNRILSLLLVLAMLLSVLPMVSAVDELEKEEIVILFTNDIHTYIANEGLRYSNVADLKNSLLEDGQNVLLVDAGDHIQGTAYGSMDKGETIIELMNGAGYDLATLGNHEFDYGMERALELVGKADFSYVSANFYHEEDGVKGETVLNAYEVFEMGGQRVAFIGITTPESFTKSTPAYFQDEEGNYIYGISGGEDGAALYADVQAAIDAAKEEADYIIALGHLGDDPASKPWTSEELIANTSGLDAFIDGHSHSTVEGKEVADKDGNMVLLTQTGEYLKTVGMMTIGGEGIKTQLITQFAGVNADVKAIEDAWIAEIDEKLGEVIGYSEVTLDNYDAEGNRIVRKQETNTGDFAADALYYLFDNMDMDVDVAIMNGGGIRNKAITGDISYLTCKTIHTFGNVACLQTVTGQQILDALEWGARETPLAEVGGFLHVAGMTYEVDASIESTVQKDEKGIWVGGPTGEYRVKNVKVYDKESQEYVALDPEAKYNMAGYNYTLRDLGDGFAMFDGAVNVLDYVMEDYQVLANYVKAFHRGEGIMPQISTITTPLYHDYPNMLINYEDINGAGRIQIVDVPEEEWDGVIVIGGLEPNLWTTKYGNVYTNCAAENFTEDLGLAWGDLATVKFLDKELILPVVPDYSYVDSGKPALLIAKNEQGKPSGYAFMAINMGNFLDTYGIAYKGTDADGNWFWTAYEGVEFPIVVTFELYEKEGYMAEYLLHELSRTNNREDYAQLTDEEFANFREVTTSGMGDNRLYRSSSPINPEIGRNTYADAAAKAAGVKTFVNLADSEEEAAAYPGFAESYYAQQNVKYLCLGVDFAAEDFQKGLAEGIRFMIANEGPYLVHCTEGKDRAGFVNAILECFMGATYEEVLADYMVTYYNYYGVEPGTEKYEAIAESNIIKSLKIAFGVEDLTAADLAAEAEEYLTEIGLTEEEIADLRIALGVPVSGDIVILFTNDIHTYIDNEGLRYSNVAAMKKELAENRWNTLLVDAGDHVQGTAYGSMDKGETIIQLMNAAGYDLATLGNHEFDYGMERALELVDMADYPYISANFYHEKDGVKGEPVLDAYKIFKLGGKKIAFVGITTPESFTKSTPAYFQDEEGNYIYGIGGGIDGAELYADVQAAIDAAKAEGADYIIGLGHLGVDPASKPWTSEEVIANVSGLDAFIDGHSHSTMLAQMYPDKDGKEVYVAQTGQYLENIGHLYITEEGISGALYDSYDNVDVEVKAIEDAWVAEIDEKLGEVIGYSEVTLDNYDADGNRLVRKQETNTGDFAADALYYLFDNMGLEVDVAIMNGGGVRNKAITGDISYLTCKNIHTFGNVACLQTVTGQQILDALEWGARETPVAEVGGFLHVAGMTYEVNTYIESTVQMDEKGVWVGGPTGEYRVKNVKIYDKETQEYVDLDLEATYNMAGYNYTLRDLGDGFAMFDGAVNVLDYVMEDYQVLANYVKAFHKWEGEIPWISTTTTPLYHDYPNMLINYEDINGAGRIVLVEEEPDPDAPVVEEVKVPSTVREGAMIPAYITLPAEYSPVVTWPVVFMLHGHGGNHNEWGGYDYISNNLAYNGMIVVTIDFPGCGASTESFTLNTMTNMKQDVLDVVDYVFKNYTIDENMVGGFGYSMGGRIVLEMIAEGFDEFDAIELVAPAEDFEDLKLLFGGPEKWEEMKAEAEKNGYVEFTTVYGQVQQLSKEWFADLAKYPDGLVEKAAEKYDGESLVIWATDDEAVSPKVSATVADVLNSATLQTYTGGHSYSFYNNDEYVCRITNEGSLHFFISELYSYVEGPFGYIHEIREDGSIVFTIEAEKLEGLKKGNKVRVYMGGRTEEYTFGKDLVIENGVVVLKGNAAEKFELATKDEKGNWIYAEHIAVPAMADLIFYVNHFTDVPNDAWYTEYVLMMADAGFIKGKTPTTFAPDDNITRAEFATLLYRMVGEPEVEGMTEPFSDVSEKDWFYKEVVWAYNAGVINGVTKTSFAPNKNVTREQVATMLYRFTKGMGVDMSEVENTNILSYEDATSVSTYAVEAITWAVGADMINGTTYSGSDKLYLDPQGNATRAQAAKILVQWVYYLSSVENTYSE